jgi:hypothetical protein
VVDRADREVDRLERSEGPLDPREELVRADHRGGVEALRGHARAQDVEAVERRLGGDRVGPPAEREVIVADVELEVLGHLVAVDDPPDRNADPGRTAQGPRLDPGDHLPEGRLGRREEIDPLARPLGREGRVAAHDEALTGELGVLDLGEVPLVEQPELQAAAFGKSPDRGTAQGADPVEADGTQRLDPGGGEHPPVAHEDNPLEAEADPQLLDRSRHGSGIAGVARHDLDRDRAAR